jgi:hypothetical protein
VTKLFLPEIPEWWSDKAGLAGLESNSPGAYHIGHVIWRQYRMRRKRVGLKLPVINLKEKGFGRRYVSTSLRVLESVGLIKAERFHHKSPEITLIIDKNEAAKLEMSYGRVDEFTRKIQKSRARVTR